MKRELEVLDEKYGVRGCFEVLSVSGVYLAKLARDPVSASRNFGLCATTAFPLPKIAVCSEDVFPDQVPSLLPLFLSSPSGELYTKRTFKVIQHCR
jgi:hypothetical protein